MRKIGITALMAAIVFAAPSLAQNRQSQEETVGIYMTGERLVENCRLFLVVQKNGGRTNSPREALGLGTCRGFVDGVLDTTEIERLKGKTEDFQAFCVPAGINANTIAEVVLQYLEDNPQHRSGSGYALVRLALAKSFPC